MIMIRFICRWLVPYFAAALTHSAFFGMPAEWLPPLVLAITLAYATYKACVETKELFKI